MEKRGWPNTDQSRRMVCDWRAILGCLGFLFTLTDAGKIPGRFEVGAVVDKTVDSANRDRHSATAEIISLLAAK